jgi:hypothetical protein
MRRFANLLGFVLALSTQAMGLLVERAAAAPGAVEPYYWRQRVFFVPYQPSPGDPLAEKVEKVQLLVSRDGGQQWAMLQEAEPRVRGFSYHAAADGEYAFALRMSDRRGKVWPEQITAPLLRIVVDTQPPQIRLDASVDAMGRVVVRYEATDQKLKPQTLQIQAQIDNGPWQRVALDPPDVSQPDRLLGKSAWRPLAAGSQLNIRAAIDDAAGNPGTAATSSTLAGPMLDPNAGPQLSSPTGGDSNWYAPSDAPPATSPPPIAAAPQRPAVDWPTGPSLGSASSQSASSPSADPFAPADGPSFGDPPPAAATTPATSTSNSPPTHFASDVSAPALLSGQADAGGAQPPAQLDAAWTTTAPPAAPAATVPAAVTPSATPPSSAGPLASSPPWVNSLTFDLDYDLQTVGPWGVSQVHLWGTRDGGRQWQRLGADQDNRSPMRVSVPDAGVYGFRIVVDGAGGVAAPTPQPGDAPELIVGVDLAAPQAELQAPQLGQGAYAGQTLITWSAQDDNIADRPVGLFYSASAEGPWSTIATNVENVGHYAWQPGRDAPPQVFLRLEVRDAAGNIAVQQTPQAFDLNLPRPTGRLRQVRPAPAPVADPSRYRTAAAPAS